MSVSATPLQWLGSFRSVPLADFFLPHLAELKTIWDPDEKQQVLHYLNAAHVVNGWLLSRTHYLDGIEVSIPWWHRTDGIWLWPESLRFYVAQLDIGLPDKFRAHMAKLNYQPPKLEHSGDPNLPPHTMREWITRANRVRTNRFYASLSRLTYYVLLPNRKAACKARIKVLTDLKGDTPAAPHDEETR
jgi:hypothetical protein